jgi:prepilin-type N-terminal cleavage/methylation domain-containing protein
MKMARFHQGQKGVSLIETLIAIALLGIVGGTLLAGMGGVYKATPIASEQDIGKSLAQSQMEYVLQQPYDMQHYDPAPIPASYGDYSAEIETDADSSRASQIEKITVTIYHGDKEVSTLEALKVNR